MSGFVYEAANSEDNCYHSDLGEIIGHKVDEIYTCLDCLENLTRQSERERIVKRFQEEWRRQFIEHGYLPIPEQIDWLVNFIRETN
jgi:hypothetical protein